MLKYFRIHLRKTMNPYYNLAPEQRPIQRLLDQFNAAQRLWKKLEPKRRARRKLRPSPFPQETEELGTAGIRQARREQECIGQWIEA
jgi:hypothetical protein